MKILYLSLDRRIPMDLPNGAALRILSTINGMKKIGHEVKLIAQYAGVGKSSDVKPQQGGFKAKIKSAIPKSIWLFLRDSADVLDDLKRVSEIEKEIEDYDPDVVFDLSAYLKDAGFIAAKRKNKPYFLEINAPTSEERALLFGAPLGWYNSKKEFRRAREANGALVVCGVLKDMLIKKGVSAEKIGIFHNGIDIDRFNIPNDERVKEKVAGHYPVIGFVGAVASYHGIGTIYAAAEKLKSEYPDLLFWIIGPAENIEGLRAKVADLKLEKNIRFEGAVPSQDVPKYIKAFDIAVLPDTAYYCSPIKLFEYAAAGVPIIAPKTLPVIEIFGEKGMATLIGENDDFSEAILKIISEPDKAKKMAIAAKEKIVNEQNWEKIASEMIEFMKRRM